MSNLKKVLLIFVVNTLLVFILCEGVGVVHFYLTTQQLFYRRSHIKLAFQEEPGMSKQPKTRLHPFWGFMPRPGMTVRELLPNTRVERLVGQGIAPDWINIAVNEYGFYSDYPYPYAPRTNDFVIGIFGGSVAHWFTLQGRKKLIEHLQRHNRLLKSRSIIILSFAQGGFKQPQQLQILTYFLAIGQHFDLVINIDGFNEVALSHLNYQKNMDLSFPSSQLILPLVGILNKESIDLEGLEALLSITKARNSLQNIEEGMARNQSAGLNLIFSLIHYYKKYNYTKKITQIDTLKHYDVSSRKSLLMQLNQLPPSITPANEFEHIARLWANSSVLMKQILEKQHISYIHVLQPNQYYCQRAFTNEETFAIDLRSPYRPGVEYGYPFLLRQVDGLRNHEVRFIDATKIFDKIPEIVYSDSCCHYNQLGNEVFASYIAREIIPLIHE